MNLIKKLFKNKKGSGLVEKIMVTAFAVAAGGAVIVFTSNVIIEAKNKPINGILDGGAGQTTEINGNQVHTNGFYVGDSEFANVVSIVGNKMYIYNPDNMYINRFDDWQTNTSGMPNWVKTLPQEGTAPSGYNYTSSWTDEYYAGNGTLKSYGNLEEYCNRAISEFNATWEDHTSCWYLELYEIAESLAY